MNYSLTDRARSLRKNATDVENRLWYFLRSRNLKGCKFHRQYVIKPYIVDFICRDRKLIIELDGGHHNQTIIYDEERTCYLEGKGFKVIRFWNHEVLKNIDDVLEEIHRFL